MTKQTKTKLNPNFWNDSEDLYDDIDHWSFYHDTYRDNNLTNDLLSQNGMYLGILNHDKTELIDCGLLEDNPDINSYGDDEEY